MLEIAFELTRLNLDLRGTVEGGNYTTYAPHTRGRPTNQVRKSRPNKKGQDDDTTRRTHQTEMSSMILEPPSYSPSAAAPIYSAEPANDEERLEFVTRSLHRATPDGSFTKKSSGVTIVLAEQEDGATVPSYSRNGVVTGEVILDDEKVLAVSVQVRLPSDVVSKEYSNKSYLLNEYRLKVIKTSQ